MVTRTDEIRDLLPQFPQLRGRNVAWQPLDGGLTNRNYLLDVDGESFVLRIAGANTELLGIDRRREFECLQAAAAAGVGPEIIAWQSSLLLLRFLPGKPLTVEDLHAPQVKKRLAGALRACHEQPVSEDLGRFSPFEAVRTYHALARERHVSFPQTLDTALTMLKRLEAGLQPTEPARLCHNDLLPANFIDDGKGIRIIDWEYAGRGDRFFDLGNLAVNAQWTDEEEAAFLADYFGEARPDDLRRLRLMRLVSDLREALWGFLQSAISPIHEPAYYLDYGAQHLDRFLLAGCSLSV